MLLCCCWGKMLRMGQCVFCNYDKSKAIRESENSFTILSDPYLLKGHCLVVPKNHYENILEVPEDILIELIKEVKEVERLLLERFGASGADIRQNYRPFQKENDLKVNHLHFHIIPREFEDELYKESMVYEKYVFKELDDKTLEEMREVLR